MVAKGGETGDGTKRFFPQGRLQAMREGAWLLLGAVMAVCALVAASAVLESAWQWYPVLSLAASFGVFAFDAFVINSFFLVMVLLVAGALLYGALVCWRRGGGAEWFKNVLDFDYKRTAKQAVGFYLAHLFLMLLALYAIGLLVTPPEVRFSEGWRLVVWMGTAQAWMAPTYVSAVSFTILIRRALMNRYGLVVLALLGTILAAFTGGLGGLAVPAIISTREHASTPMAQQS